MPGADITQESLFTVAKLDDFVPVNHPLRAIRKLANTALQRMSALFDTLYADTGRTSIAPEKLMRAQLLQLLYSLRSERMLMEQLGYNLLFRWFVGSRQGRQLPAAPRTDPYVRNYRIRLLPRVCDAKRSSG